MPFVQAAESFRQSLAQAPANPLGIFLRGILERASQRRLLQETAQFEASAAVEKEKQLLPLKEASATRLLQERARLFPPQPKALSGDAAGRLSLASQGEKFARRAKNLLFPTGTPESFRRGLIGAARNPFGRTFSGEAQDVEFYIKRAIDAQLRAETGAAVSPGELDRLTKEFMANTFADPRSAFTRLDELEIGLKKTRSAIDPTGFYSQLGTSPFETSTEDVSGLSDDEIREQLGL